MAYIRTHDTAHRNRRSGKPVKRYEVVWRANGDGRNGFAHRCLAPVGRRVTPPAEQAEARRGELDAAKHTQTGTAALADACKAGARTFGEYAVAWLDAQRKKVATGALKQSTYAMDAYTPPPLRADGARRQGDWRDNTGGIAMPTAPNLVTPLTPPRRAMCGGCSVRCCGMHTAAMQSPPSPPTWWTRLPRTAHLWFDGR